jgi:hypothetical protein
MAPGFDHEQRPKGGPLNKTLIPPRYRLRVKQRLAIVEYALE